MQNCRPVGHKRARSMELGLSVPPGSSFRGSNTTSQSGAKSGSSTHHGNKSGPSTPSKVVNFKGETEGEKKREKFLTAKYGVHQMALIRKRLRVEMWMFDQLQLLYSQEGDSSNEVEIDLDEVLDIEDVKERKQFIKDILIDSKSSRDVINKFVDDLLEKANTL